MSNQTHSFFHSLVMRKIFMQHVVYFAVRFYGKDKSSQFSHPIKTDLDTLREGYRFAQLVNALSSWHFGTLMSDLLALIIIKSYGQGHIPDG